MSKPTGGPAFPPHPNSDPRHGDPMGMSLRDYFAAHAPVTYQQVAGPNPIPAAEARAALATERYAYADAMLQERNRS